jgi:O-antigen ligase
MLFVMRPITLIPTIVLLVVGMCFLFSNAFRVGLVKIINEDDLILIAAPMVVWFLVSLLVGIWHLGLTNGFFPENEFKIFLAVGILGLNLNKYSKRFFLYGVLFGSVAAFLNVIYGTFIYDETYPRISGTTNHPIHFGNFSAMLGVLLLTFACVDLDLNKILKRFCVFAALLAFVSSSASLSRSSFVILVCLVPLFWVDSVINQHRRMLYLGGMALFLSIMVVFSSPQLQEKLRIKEAITDIQKAKNNNYLTSIGARLAMWKAASIVFEENLYIGIGPSAFESELRKKMEQKTIPEITTFNQPHNDFLHAASSGGLVKLCAYIFLILGPFLFFYRKYKSNIESKRKVLSLIGMQIVAIYFLTGLTNSNFDLQIYSMTYGVLVCLVAKLILFEYCDEDSKFQLSRS